MQLHCSSTRHVNDTGEVGPFRTIRRPAPVTRDPLARLVITAGTISKAGMVRFQVTPDADADWHVASLQALADLKGFTCKLACAPVGLPRSWHALSPAFTPPLAQFAGKLIAGNFELYQGIEEDHAIMAWKAKQEKLERKKEAKQLASAARERAKQQLKHDQRSFYALESERNAQFKLTAGFDRRCAALKACSETPGAHTRISLGIISGKSSASTCLGVIGISSSFLSMAPQSVRIRTLPHKRTRVFTK